MITRLNDNFSLKDGGYSNYEDTKELPRHRWYYYKEGFSPLLVEKAIQEVGLKKTDIILDPFNGSGTTTLTAAINGIPSVGIEVNPFTSFLSEAKQKNVSIDELQRAADDILSSIDGRHRSNLIGFSTFSETDELEKWLFNDAILNTFESAWRTCSNIQSYNVRKLLKLVLINSAMDNCNAKRDGKCLRYRDSWNSNSFDKQSFLSSFVNILDVFKEDIKTQPIETKSFIINGDARFQLNNANIEKFKLCITSPPYLNTFDYTDIYRPELFLGKFVNNMQQLYNLRLKTVRSHIQAKWEVPVLSDFGPLYQQSINLLNDNKEKLMHKNIPLMVQAYFEDMLGVLKSLKQKAANDAELWLVVSNSAYANEELPVDLIIGDLGTKAGWYLKEIGILRYIQRRKTKHSPDINSLRESVVIFSTKKVR